MINIFLFCVFVRIKVFFILIGWHFLYSMFSFFFVFSCFPLKTFSHSYLTVPISRSNQAATRKGCRFDANCPGPCDAPTSKVGINTPVSLIKRGDPIKAVWPRNNHAAGFIRFAWAPTTKSDNPDSFNDYITDYTCHESTCRSSTPDLLGGDIDGDFPGKCTAEIVVPAQLNDGNWTLQWTWFGGAFALSDYYSCVDYTIEGGKELIHDSIIPKFKGGDPHNPNDSGKCLAFNTNKIGICVHEPCSPTPKSFSGPPHGFGNKTSRKQIIQSSKTKNKFCKVKKNKIGMY